MHIRVSKRIVSARVGWVLLHLFTRDSYREPGDKLDYCHHDYQNSLHVVANSRVDSFTQSSTSRRQALLSRCDLPEERVARTCRGDDGFHDVASILTNSGHGTASSRRSRRKRVKASIANEMIRRHAYAKAASTGVSPIPVASQTSDSSGTLVQLVRDVILKRCRVL